MKTPREILLTRHCLVEPKLDEIRRGLIRQWAGSRENEAGDSSSGLLQWIISLRWHLAGLTASWLLIGLLQVNLPTAQAPMMAAKSRLSRSQVQQAYWENRRQFQQLLEPLPARENSPPPALNPPRRSDVPSDSVLA
jgi:hypothetical protein